MTAPVETPEPTPAFATARPEPSGWAVLGVWSLASTVFGLLAMVPVIDGGEYRYLVDAQRVARGEVQGLDFFYGGMPGNALVTGLVFWLAGPSLLAARLLLAGVVAALLTAAWRLGSALDLGPRLALVPALAAVLPYVGTPLFYHPGWLAQAASAGALLALFVAVRDQRPRAWALAGGLAGLTACFDPVAGGALLVGGAVGFAWLARRESWPLDESTSAANAGFAGAIAPFLALALYLADPGALGRVIGDAWAATAASPGWTSLVREQLADPEFLRIPIADACQGLIAVLSDLWPFLAGLWALAWLARMPRSRELDARGRFLGLLAWITLALMLAGLVPSPDTLVAGAGMLPAALFTLLAALEDPRTGLPTEPGPVAGSAPVALAALALAGLLGTLDHMRVAPGLRPTIGSPEAIVRDHPTMARLRSDFGISPTLLTSGGGQVYNFYGPPNPVRALCWLCAEHGDWSAAEFRELSADLLQKPPTLIAILAPDQRVADAEMGVLLARYTFRASLTHVIPGEAEEARLHVYQLKVEGLDFRPRPR